ncbi:hypothetical protein HY639_00035 [Candidatus Woesearchaeota archaeon]|nr:hypothetical protein [Candidatus Woesearchaeota archaeon]
MSLENTLEETQKRLRNLRQTLPREHDFVHDFGEYLADKVNNISNPEMFCLQVELALAELRRGYDRQGQQLQTNLVGQPQPIYGMLRLRVPVIADAVFSSDYAARVREFYASAKTK